MDQGFLVDLGSNQGPFPNNGGFDVLSKPLPSLNQQEDWQAYSQPRTNIQLPRPLQGPTTPANQ